MLAISGSIGRTEGKDFTCCRSQGPKIKGGPAGLRRRSRGRRSVEMRDTAAHFSEAPRDNDMYRRARSPSPPFLSFSL